MRIVYSKQAIKAVGQMDRDTKQRIQKGIALLPRGDVKPLRGAPGNFRLRVGDFRIVFAYEDEKEIVIKRIAPRGDAYKGGW
jgi:mRNA interferase RelE/StbE